MADWSDCGKRRTIFIFAKVSKLDEGEVKRFELRDRRHCAWKEARGGKREETEH